MKDFVEVFMDIFVNYFEKEISEFERWIGSIPEEELKSVMLSYIEENKRRAISESKFFEELVDTAEELVNEKSCLKDLSMGGRGIGNKLEEVLVTPLSNLLFKLSPKEGSKVLVKSVRHDGLSFFLEGVVV